MSRAHLYVIDGDLTKVAVDAWYLPVDHHFRVTKHWRSVVVQLDPEGTKTREPWAKGELARFLGYDEGSAVWLGDVGRVDAGFDHYIQCALQFVELATERHERDRPATGRRPIVAIPHLGTGAGGAKGFHGDLLRELIGAITEAMNSGRIETDVILVSHGSTAEAAAQRARFGVSASWRTDQQWSFEHNQEHLHTKAVELAEQLERGQAATFMGAGVSMGAGLPGWIALLEAVGDATEPKTSRKELQGLSDPRDMANLLHKRLDKKNNSLARILATSLSKSKYSLQHGLLASLPCNEYITTNVDELFERAATASKGTLKVVPQRADSDRWLLKLHGSISDESSLVFTRENFLDLGRGSRALFGLVQAMLFTRHMIFVGYGLGDEDFHEVVYDVRSAFPNKTMSSRIGTALIPTDDPIKRELWDDTLDIMAMRPAGHDMEEAVRDLERFLDLVGMLASDRAAFLMNQFYDGMLDEEERKLRELLAAVARRSENHTDDESAWRDVRRLLRRLGAELP